MQEEQDVEKESELSIAFCLSTQAHSNSLHPYPVFIDDSLAVDLSPWWSPSCL